MQNCRGGKCITETNPRAPHGTQLSHSQTTWKGSVFWLQLKPKDAARVGKPPHSISHLIQPREWEAVSIQFIWAPRCQKVEGMDFLINTKSSGLSVSVLFTGNSLAQLEIKVQERLAGCKCRKLNGKKPYGRACCKPSYLKVDRSQGDTKQEAQGTDGGSNSLTSPSCCHAF